MRAALFGEFESHRQQPDQGFVENLSRFPSGGDVLVGPRHHAIGMMSGLFTLVEVFQTHHFVDGPHG